MKLCAHTALLFDLRRPRDNYRVTRAAEVGGNLLCPLKRRIHRPSPARGEMVVVLGTAQLIDDFQFAFDRFEHAIKPGQLVRCSVETAFGRSTIITENI